MPRYARHVSRQPLYTWPELFRQAMYATIGVLLTVIAGIVLVRSGLVSGLSIGLLLLGGVALTSLFTTSGVALYTAFISFAMYNLVFFAPSWRFVVDDVQDVTTLAIFMIPAFVVARTAGLRHDRAEMTRRLNLENTTLYTLSKGLSQASTSEDCCRAAYRGLQNVLQHAPHFVLLDDKNRITMVYPAHLRLSDLQVKAVRTAVEENVTIRPFMGGFDELDAEYHPLQTDSGVIGVVGFTYREGEKNTRHILNKNSYLHSYLSQLAIALERIRLETALEKANLESERESLRSALLSSISHDLKSPLVTIVGSLSTVRLMHKRLKEKDRLVLLESAEGEAHRLNQIIDNVLEMTRLEAGSVVPRREWVVLADVVEDAQRRLAKRRMSFQLTTQLPEQPLPLMYADAVLLAQVFYNLFDNACKYATGEVNLTAQMDKNALRITVRDFGTGLDSDQQDKIFDKFFRVSQRDSRVAGSGLGLAICRGLVQAHEAELTAGNTLDEDGNVAGAVFTLTFPAKLLKERTPAHAA